MFKKVVLILSLFTANCIRTAEQSICKIEDSNSRTGIEKILESCKSGEILLWRKLSTNFSLDLINNYCHREKQINVTDNYAYGVCTLSDKS